VHPGGRKVTLSYDSLIVAAGDVLLLLQNLTRRGRDLPFGEDSRGHLV
jgi:hypothetical protein